MSSSNTRGNLPGAFPPSSAGRSEGAGNAAFGYWKLSSDLRNRMQRKVDQIRTESKAKSVLVITDSGSPLITSGEVDGVEGIAALGVGAYHAMSRLILLCGLGEALTVHHQSERGGVLMTALSEGVIVVMVLEDVLSPGLARFVLQRESRSLEKLIVEARQK